MDFTQRTISKGEAGGRKLAAAFGKLEAWLEKNSYAGIDPFDALRSPLLRRLTFGSRWMGVVWVQLFRRSPLNLRGLFGVTPGYNAKGMGLFLASYVRRYRATGDTKDLERIGYFAGWLHGNRCQAFHEACWGYNFDWPNRSFFAPAGTPNIVSTVFICHALLDRYDLLGTGEDVAAARSACDFLLKRLSVFRDSDGECFGYTPLDRRYVHNANLLGASLLARVARITGEDTLRARAAKAAAFTAAKQRADGSWPYGIAAADGFVDNFHTAFNLVYLLDYMRDANDWTFDSNVTRGYKYWKDTFFSPDGMPKYFSGKLYPIDIHAVAQAILTFLAFRERDAEADARALRLAEWATENMQDGSGYFYYQIGRFCRNRIAYIRWSQAWMFRALAEWLLPASQVVAAPTNMALAGMRDNDAR